MHLIRGLADVRQLPMFLVVRGGAGQNRGAVCATCSKLTRKIDHGNEADLDEVALAFGFAPQTLRVW